ncbi:MAG: 50S ribosomal protein L32 [Patescibacteria group bacterium]
MAVPKHRRTSSSAGQRRMHIFIAPAVLITCKKCGKPVRPHTVCPHCGYYKGREVVNILGKLTKKEKKQKEREIAKVEKEQKKESSLSMEELSKK